MFQEEIEEHLLMKITKSLIDTDLSISSTQIIFKIITLSTQRQCMIIINNLKKISQI